MPLSNTIKLLLQQYIDDNYTPELISYLKEVYSQVIESEM